MAGNAAVFSSGSVDTGAKLRADKLAAQRERVKAVSNVSPARTGLAQNTANNREQDGAQAFPTDIAQDEAFRRTARANQVRRQIGSAAGLDLDRRSISGDDDSEFDAVQQDYANRESNFFTDNQIGIDARANTAKRGELENLQNQALQKGMQALTKTPQKELSGLAVNLGADAAEGIDAAFEDFGLTQFITFIKNCVSAVRTIFKPNVAEHQNAMQQLRSQMTESFLDTFAPPFTLATMAGISGLLGFLFQLLIIGFFLVILSFILIFLVGILTVAQNPFSTIVTLFRSTIGI